ncbi:MAG: membrane protein insertase YidC [Chlorobiaceae bacterium]|nr:membrane protein insertase YidC [Chlorobiaceae bacterium]
MDRNSVIGFALIAAIMMVWLQFMNPQNKTQVEKTATRSEMVDTVPTGAIPPPAAVRADSLGTFAQASVGAEKTTIIENDLFTATLSSRGATLKSLVLKKHLDGSKKLFNLVSDQQKGALSMLFLSSDGKRIDTRDLNFRSVESSESVTVTGRQTQSVSYIFDVDDSRSIQVTWNFTGDSYEVGYDLKLTGLGTTMVGNEYQLVWNGGLTYSEKNKVDESTNAIASAFQGGGVVKLDAKDAKQAYKEESSGKAQWVAVRNKYFVAALIPLRESEGIYLYGTKKAGQEFENYVAALKMTVPSGQQVVQEHYRLYLGPIDYNTVRALHVGLEKIMDFGWDWLTRPFAEYVILPIFNWMNKYVTNYGLIIIIFAFLIKMVTYPLSLASTKSMKKMSALQPLMQELQEKYKDNPAKMQTELGRIYKEAGVNPLGGCLPTVIQMPLLFAMFYVFRSSIQLRQHGFLWAKDLSVPDSILDFGFAVPLYGDHIAVMPILMAVTVFVQQKITPTTQTNDQMKIMMWMFPAMMLLFFNSMPAGLGLYYLMFNIFSIAQQAYINASVSDEEKAAAAMQVASVTKPAQSQKKGVRKK